MKKIRPLFFISAILLIITVSCNTEKAKWPIALDHVVTEIQSIFYRMDSTAASISEKIAEHPDDTAMIKTFLFEGYGGIRGVVENCYITPEGILKLIVPQDYHHVEGSDISYQDHIIKVQQTKKPVLSVAFRAVEGFQAVVLAYPILSPDNELLGITVLLIQPDSFLRDIITGEMTGIPADIWVMQKDGIILYDADEEEIGRNLFTDPLYQDYTESLRTAAKIVEKDNGEAIYDFLGRGLETPVTNQAFWTTVGMYGMEWKIVLVNPIGKHLAHRTAADLGLKSASQGLKDLSRNEEFLSALAANSREDVDYFFKAFYDLYPIYTIEWVDSTVTTRFGHPALFSLENYQITPEKTEQRAFYDAVVNREETNFEMRLLEGNIGIFTMYPVDLNGRNLGSIYYLVIKR